MAITLQEAEHVAELAKLEIAASEKQDVTAKLSAVIDYLQQLQEVDISQVEPMIRVLPQVNVFREDEIHPGLSLDEVLANAPESEQGFFKVPSIL